MNIREIVSVSKVYKNRITVPKEVRKRCNLKDGDDILWAIARNGEITLRKKGEEDMYF